MLALGLALSACGTTDGAGGATGAAGMDAVGGLETIAPDGSAGGGDAAGPAAFEIAKSTKARLTSQQLPTGDQATFTAANADFAVALHQAVRDRAGNLFYSPLSIQLALAMTWAGARGDTADQIAAALRFQLPPATQHAAFNWLDRALQSRNEPPPGVEGEGFALRIANATWGQSGFPFEQPFLDTLAESYGAGLHLLDFGADPEGSREIINAWVEQQTEDRIKDLLPQGAITPLTRMVLTNAIYFLAPWASPFDPKHTADGPFTRPDGSAATVPMMHQLLESARYGTGTGFQLLEMAYNGGLLSMVVLLPDAEAFDTVEAGLTGASFSAAVDAMTSQRVDVTFPRFEITRELPLVPVLQSMGMVDAFSPTTADFAGITTATQLYISDVLHKAFVKVDEAGTEAAAATAVIAGATSVPPPPVPFVVDRPFLFVIRDVPTGALLFVGRVTDPS